MLKIKKNLKQSKKIHIFAYQFKPIFMKRIYILFALLFLTGMIPKSFSQQNEKTGNWFKTGSVITYHVVNATKEYDYVVSDLVIDKNIAFNWKMTEPVNYTGSIKIFNNAVDTASIMVNNFENGSNMTMINKTTAMISRKLYKRLLSQVPVNITFDNRNEVLKFVRNETYSATIEGVQQDLDVMVAETETGNTFWILNNPQYPLIIKMKLDFTIALKSVVTSK